MLLLSLLALSTLTLAQVSMVSEEGKFKITFPGEYSFEKQTIDTDIGPILMYMYMYEEDERACMVTYSDYGEEFEASVTRETLESAKEGFIENLGLEEEYCLEIRMKGNEGLYYKAAGNGMYATIYVFLRGSRLYQLGSLQQDSYDDPTFLESFEMLD